MQAWERANNERRRERENESPAWYANNSTPSGGCVTNWRTLSQVNSETYYSHNEQHSNYYINNSLKK